MVGIDRPRETTSPVATCEKSNPPIGSPHRDIRYCRSRYRNHCIAQLSFEHYEKMTDWALSLEGKANYLSPIIQRNNLNTPLYSFRRCSLVGIRSFRCRHVFEYDGAAALRALRLRDHRLGNCLSPKGVPTWLSATDLDREAALELGALALYEAG